MKVLRKVIIVMGLFLINSAFTGTIPQHYQSSLIQFVNNYKGETYTVNNDVSPEWIRGAINTMRQAGFTGDLNIPDVFSATVDTLWSQLEYTVNYYAQQPAFRNDTTFKSRVWKSLQRGLLQFRQQESQGPTIPSRPLPKITFESILKGSLGEPYTSKVNEIYNSGNTTFINALFNDINRDIVAGYAQESTRIKNIKDTIDRIYGFFVKNRERNTAPVQTGKLTFESILKGALGEPYTSKVNEIYNSGVSVYVNALVSDINRDINAFYTEELIRINKIKATIDRIYGFLVKSR